MTKVGPMSGWGRSSDLLKTDTPSTPKPHSILVRQLTCIKSIHQVPPLEGKPPLGDKVDTLDPRDLCRQGVRWGCGLVPIHRFSFLQRRQNSIAKLVPVLPFVWNQTHWALMHQTCPSFLVNSNPDLIPQVAGWVLHLSAFPELQPRIPLHEALFPQQHSSLPRAFATLKTYLNTPKQPIKFWNPTHTLLFK